MTSVLNIVLPAFVVILIGFLIGKRKQTANMSVLVDIAFNISGPAITFVSMLDKKIVLLDAGKIWAAAFLIMFGCGIIAWIVFKILRQKHSALYLPISVMNTVNLPFPIIYLAFGSAGLFAATLFCIPNILLLYSLGIFIAAGKHWKEGVREVVKVPILYAAVLGLIFNLLDIRLPEVVMNSLNLVATMAIPLVLIVLGYNLSRVKIASIPTTLIASVLRIGVGLLLGLLAVELFHLEGILKAVVILDSAMPAAVNAAVIATKYENESDMVSSVVFVTTVISLVSIPFLLSIIS
jgi:malate permease and related proteins